MHNAMNNIKELADKMNSQDNRSTSWPIFIVVEDKKVYGVDSNFSSDGHERKDRDSIRTADLCQKCRTLYDKGEELPEECDEWECDDSFIDYRIDKDVFNDRGAFFLTAEACDNHIKSQGHHYEKSARSYAISAYHNYELQQLLYNISQQGANPNINSYPKP